MEKIIIKGGNKLFGDVYINGMKNAALPIIFATILTANKCIIENVPKVSDITMSFDILTSMGAKIKYLNETTVKIDTTNLEGGDSPFDLVSRMRGSTYLLGAELARYKKAKVAFPGGCNFGTRPIDMHIKGFEALGATVSQDENYVYAEAPNGLVGNHIYFDIVSVGATVNLMLAATLAEGQTILENAAREPHIVDLANFLNTCGADIKGAGTGIIKINGVEKLHGCVYDIIPDMIEAGSYMCAVAATGGEVNIKNVIPKHLEIISTKLVEMGVEIETYDDYLKVRSTGKLKPTNIQTLPYPGFPTDMHPQFSTLLAIADGESTVYETIWKNRFKYVHELEKMGASVTVHEPFAAFKGVEKLHGASVRSVDLRAGAAIVIAGLVAEGTTEVTDIFTIERGYLDIVGKLKELGADISKVYIDENAFA
ncbi:MAG: UDP-N-acetylglucosamine 1-carboxyvinyltransferase [Clostridia bacterium]|nr:UDP-N-acetylglucosamine 1-carboxyvinyltransferase [Clostridia bacterium]